MSESPGKPVDRSRVVDDVIAGLHRVGFVTDVSQVVSRWSARLEPGYPTPFLGRDERLAEVEPGLRALGIWSRGRFGAWKYEVANQDHSLMQGVEAVDHILCGREETTFLRPDVVNAGRQAAPAPLPPAGS